MLVNSPSPLVMGIINILQDENPVAVAEQMTTDGADLLDVGIGVNASVSQESKILIPAIQQIKERVGVPISVFTSNSEIMHEAVSNGASMIHDPLALTKTGALNMAVGLDIVVCLICTDIEQNSLSKLYSYFESRIDACIAAGLAREKIIIDPGFGFGKTKSLNINILRYLKKFKSLDVPILLGFSKTGMLGQILDTEEHERVYGEVAAEIVAFNNGADIIRTRDVKAIADALKVLRALG